MRGLSPAWGKLGRDTQRERPTRVPSSYACLVSFAVATPTRANRYRCVVVARMFFFFGFVFHTRCYAVSPFGSSSSYSGSVFFGEWNTLHSQGDRDVVCFQVVCHFHVFVCCTLKNRTSYCMVFLFWILTFVVLFTDGDSRENVPQYQIMLFFARAKSTPLAAKLLQVINLVNQHHLFRLLYSLQPPKSWHKLSPRRLRLLEDRGSDPQPS